MPSYAKFQSDNNKYTDKTSRLRTNNPDFNPTIQVNGKKENAHFMRNLKRWSDLVAYFRWYPDCFYALITPETGSLIRLGPDQLIILRCLCRFKSTYFVAPRGMGKTMLALMYAFHQCIFYPNVQIALTAQTRENSAKLIKDKYDELLRAFPLLKDEIYNFKFSKDTVEVEFHNGSRIINIANNQSSKGAHVQRGIVDEDNLTDEKIYLDALEPIFTTVPRRTVGHEGCIDPFEMNGGINQLTSAGKILYCLPYIVIYK